MLTSSGGYEDKLLENGNYWVKYQGDGSQTYEGVLEYWKRRASELCSEGYETLRLEKDFFVNTNYGTAATTYHTWPSWDGEIKCNKI